MTDTTRLLAAFGLLALLASLGAAQGPTVTKVVKTEAGGFQVLRDGKPFYINGVGGSGPRALLASCGANALRTWGAGPDTQGILDDAQRLGLTVTVGLWLNPADRGMRYGDPAAVAAEVEKARKIFLQYKDHPALLSWGIGNEMEGFGAGDDPNVWKCVQAIAKVAHDVDPNHPTMTVVAEMGGKRAACVEQYCPDIDIIGINSYAGGTSIGERYRKAGGTKPYAITEYGPPGVWEIGRNEFGAAEEWPSTEKANFYRNVYLANKADKTCVGGYAFTWGYKREATATWFGLLLPDDTKLAGVDALTELWTGKPPANHCPALKPLVLDRNKVYGGETVKVTVDASDVDGDAFTAKWLLAMEPSVYTTGGATFGATKEFPEAFAKSSTTGAELTMPEMPGFYRVFVYLHDGKGGSAVANRPILVRRPAGQAPPAPAATLPLVVYAEDAKAPAYIPSGWRGTNMGDTKLDTGCTDMPHGGAICARVSYAAPGGSGTIIWQNPANNWGGKVGGFNLTGAQSLTFWARGAEGGEQVEFGYGAVDGATQPYYDTASATTKLTLTQGWRLYTLDLTGKDLRCLISGFSMRWNGQGKPITFFVDDIRYGVEAPVAPAAAPAPVKKRTWYQRFISWL
jgi:hypothetical protein